ncbi:hypothetical protein D9758_014029 [Tetrapyrgos nigripes]|uniref:Cytochrome P450 n=1 Tax=Tetrapyrgos nigripes TaxID=182062 RepID=A0A8H5D0D1_9AGAR|nr:hypothetical protein D9758_014029 [Tetrapyrgos nigripes]
MLSTLHLPLTFPNLMVLLGGLWFATRLILYVVQKPLKFLRGPAPTSLLCGYEYDLFQQENVGDKEYKWYEEYGTAFRVSGVYAEDVLMTADPRALQYILQTSGKLSCHMAIRYRFLRPVDFQRRICRLFDKGEIHQRQRKVLNPAFSAQQLRQFLTMFQESALHLSRKWKEDMAQDGLTGKKFNIPFWLGKMTLDIIGKTSFDFDFGAIDNKEGIPLRVLFSEIFKDSIKPTKLTILQRSLERYSPALFNMFPIKENVRHHTFLTELRRIARNVYERKEWAEEEDVRDKKDILSVLARANHTEDTKRRLNDSEVIAQVATMISAGQETISFSTTYLLYELSQHSEDQARVHHEISDLRAKIGPDSVPTSQDYDSMPYFNAVIKEALRLHSILPQAHREAANDDIIPLEFPIITASGEVVSQIPIKKGQRIHVSIGAYNRFFIWISLACVWGPDANKWNPSRFLGSDNRMSQTNIGVMSNLTTFSGGIRGCIGWRFALMEMQSILFTLLESFDFSFPVVPCKSNAGKMEDEYELQRLPAGLMVPVVKGKGAFGPSMPLNVELRAA